jgi:hypothetical protein
VTYAPIALFAYNRPDHFRRTVEALRAAALAQDSRLWVFCDGPKQARDKEKIAQVRAVARTIDGFASVNVVEREQNVGLAASVVDGVTFLCKEFGRVIVTEDDLIVAPAFLSFLNEALVRYEREERVMEISAYMYPGEFGAPGESLFLPTTSCWGWATWTRAWDFYEPSATGAEVLWRDDAMRRRFDLNGSYDYSGMLRRQLDGHIDSWGIRWYWSVFKRDGLVLYPARTLVRNIGVDGSGTHGGGTAALQPESEWRIESAPARYPDRVETDESALLRVAADLRSMRDGMFARLWRRVVA